jgi:hypothetical protein
VNEAEMTECPLAECPCKTNSPKAVRTHFRNKHNKDTIIIEEEGPLPRCPFCGIFRRTVGEKHIQISKGYKILIQETVFTIKGAPTKSTNEFKYLGGVLERNDNDWPAVRHAIQRAQMVGGHLQRLLTKDHADTKTMSSLYKAVVQAVLLYGSETWVLTGAMEKTLQSFHWECARYITGKHIRPDLNDLEGKIRICPLSDAILEEAGLLPVQEYIKQRRSTIQNFTTSRPIYEK